jgi:hypothetical protein
MADRAVPAPRPPGIIWLAILCAIFGLESLVGAMRLFPLWLAAAKQHRYGSMSLAWVEVLSAVSGFAAAYGLWRGRRWARIPFLVAALLLVATIGLITMFGVGEVGGQRGWVMGGMFMALVVAAAAGLIRYVWRST